MMKKNQEGQSLVLLLFFVLMAMTFAVTAILMSIIGSGSITSLESGIEARQLADSGAENALLRLVRDPAYTGEEYPDGSVEIDVTGTTNKTIAVTAHVGAYTRTVEVLTQYDNNVLSVVSWKEVY